MMKRSFIFDAPEGWAEHNDELSKILDLSGVFNAHIRAERGGIRVDLLQPFGYWGTADEARVASDSAALRIKTKIYQVLQANTVNIVLTELNDFRAFVERQGFRAILAGGTPSEEVGQVLLQAFLTNRSYQEVPVRGGRSDILLFLKYRRRILIETKIWRGRQYHEEGIAELKEYIAGENDDGKLAAAFLVIFDPTNGAKAAEYLSSWERGGGHPLIHIVVIRINLPRPSKLAKPLKKK